MASNIDVNPLSIHIGAEIGGVDLSQPLAPDTVKEIRAALLEAVAVRDHPEVAAELSDARARLRKLKLAEEAEAAEAAKAAAARAAAEPDADLCVVCLEGSRTHAFVPCGHKAVCERCSLSYQPWDGGPAATSTAACPMCREPYSSVVRIWG